VILGGNVCNSFIDHPKDWPWSSFSFYANRKHGLIRVDPVRSVETLAEKIKPSAPSKTAKERPPEKSTASLRVCHPSGLRIDLKVSGNHGLEDAIQCWAARRDPRTLRRKGLDRVS